MRKIHKLSALLLSLLLALFCSVPALADGITAEEDEGTPEEIEASTSSSESIAMDGLDVPAESAILIETTTGQILYEKDPHKSMPPASITKIMTMLLVMEQLEAGKITLQSEVTGSEYASSMGGTQIWLNAGEVFTVDELLKAVAVASANDAAVALAEFVAGTEEAFADLMNQKAKSLGMENTNFMNATGLDATGHVSTAYDISLMSQELLKHDTILQYTTIWMDELRNGETALVNTNKLVRYYEGCTGLKTGTTDGAGNCLAASATRGEMSLISVTMGSDSSADRFAAGRNLLDYGFNGFTVYKPSLPVIDPIPVLKGDSGLVPLELAEFNGVVIQKGSEERIEQQIQLAEDLMAPVEAGQQVGTITYTLDGKILCEVAVSTREAVEKISFTGAFWILLKSLFTL